MQIPSEYDKEKWEALPVWLRTLIIVGGGIIYVAIAAPTLTYLFFSAH